MNRTQRFQRFAFNLVEILLAMMVVGIALLAIIGLIPIGINASQKAVGNNYAADSADQTLGFYAAWLRENWTAAVQTPGIIPESPPDISTLNDFAAVESDTASSSEDGGSLYNITSLNGVYRIKQVTNTTDGAQLDFDAIVRVWKSPTTGWEYDGSNWAARTDSNYDKRVQLNVEVSWPSVKPYSGRQKRFYVIEVSNPN